MNYQKYFSDYKYQYGSNDCWTFVQQVYKDEHNRELPDYPICATKPEIASFLTSNIDYEIVDKAEKGCIVYYNNGNTHHAGYAINDKLYIHKTRQRVEVSNIPEKAIIYKIL